MDNLTHTLAGTALAGAGLRKATPLATATLALAANAPDLDALIYAFDDPYAALAFRRGWTHGPIAWLVLPIVVAGLVLTWDRWVRRRRRPDAAPARARPVLLLAVVGVLTHPLLDWMNIYGIRLLMPFTDRWFYGDALFIVDPWLWLLLGGATFLAFRPRRLALAGWIALAMAATALLFTLPVVPIAARAVWIAGLGAVAITRRARAPERSARWGLGLGVAYLVLMVLSSAAASRAVRAAAADRGIESVREILVAPEPANPLAYGVLVQTPTAYHPGELRWTGVPRVRIGPDSIPIPPPLPAIRAAARTDDAHDFLSWSRFPVFRIAALPRGYVVEIRDARYGDVHGAGLGGVVVRLDRAMRPVR